MFADLYFRGALIGAHASGFLFHQRLQFFLAHGVVPLENVHSLVAACGHYTKVVIPLQPPVIDGRVSEVMEGEVFNPGLFHG